MGKIQKKVISLRRVPDDKSLTLTVMILRINEKLINLFQKKDFRNMAKMLGQLHAVVITPNYTSIYGGASASTWAALWSPGASLVIEPVNFYLSGELAHKKVGDKLYDGYAFVVEKYRVIIKTKDGQILNNSDGKFDLALRHQTRTPWS